MLHYRTITAADDAALAKIIRTNLEQLHLDVPGTAYFDPELDHMSQYYAKAPEKRAYFIALDKTEKVVGGVGVAEFAPIPGCAEVQKLYLADSAKGKGHGKALMCLAEDWAREAGYAQLYLETHSNLTTAMRLYEKLGFQEIEKPSTVLHGRGYPGEDQPAETNQSVFGRSCYKKFEIKYKELNRKRKSIILCSRNQRRRFLC